MMKLKRSCFSLSIPLVSFWITCTYAEGQHRKATHTDTRVNKYFKKSFFDVFSKGFCFLLFSFGFLLTLTLSTTLQAPLSYAEDQINQDCIRLHMLSLILQYLLQQLYHQKMSEVLYTPLYANSQKPQYLTYKKDKEAHPC